MNHDELKAIAMRYLDNRSLESDCLDYKKSNLRKDAILKSLCAFANNLMNRRVCMLLLGVEEEKSPQRKGTPKRPIAGFPESSLETIENEMQSLVSYIKPKIDLDITHEEADSRYFVILALSGNEKGPYEVTQKAWDDPEIHLKPGRYVRSERESRLATLREEFELLKRFAGYHFSSTVSKNATIDDLDGDIMNEYVRLSSSKGNLIGQDKSTIAERLGLLDPSDPTKKAIKVFAVLMFCPAPERFVPCSYVELIRETPLGLSSMESKEFKGPIWKILQSVMSYFDNEILRSYTIRRDDKTEHEVIWNYPRPAVEELLTNAIVHKNYETPRSIQIFIYYGRIVITNYNRPIPPITYRLLNVAESFPNRPYENEEIRALFRAAGLMESWGTGVWKAKQSLRENGSPTLHFEEFDENVDITSVAIFENENYRKIDKSNIVRDSKESLLETLEPNLVNIMSPNGKKSGSNGKKPGRKGKNGAINPICLPPNGKKSGSNGKKSENRETATSQIVNGKEAVIGRNKLFAKDRISSSGCSPTIRKSLLYIVDSFYDAVFGSEDISSSLGCSPRTARNYLIYLVRMGLIEPVGGIGKRKYRFVR